MADDLLWSKVASEANQWTHLLRLEYIKRVSICAAESSRGINFALTFLISNFLHRHKLLAVVVGVLEALEPSSDRGLSHGTFAKHFDH